MKRIVSLLLVVMLVCSLAVTAGAAGSDKYVRVTTTSAPGMLVVTLTAAEATTNGLITVAYNTNELRLAKEYCDATVCSMEVEDGVVTLGYAVSTENTIEKGEQIAMLRFVVTCQEATTRLDVTVENFNDKRALNLELDPIEVVVKASNERADESVEKDPEFKDVSKNDWFHDAVSYVVNQGYFKGISDTEFGPYQSMSRAMFVTVLGRMAGVNADKYTNEKFTDVQSGSYYEGYVVWAAKNGIVQGTSDTTFSPDAAVTREQMAVFLYRYAKYLGMDTSLMGTAELTGFADADQVSDWATTAVLWAVRNSIINGTEKGLEPAATANRAQVAQIIYRFDLLDR